MNRLIKIVGYEGITTDHKLAVNDLPYVHDELLAAVSYSDALLTYFERIRKTSFELFKAEVVNHLSENAKFSDVLLRFPEGELNPEEILTALQGQAIEQVYDISTIVQYGIFAPQGMLLYMMDNYHIRVSIYFGHSGMKKGAVVYTEEFQKSDADVAEMSYIQVDFRDNATYDSAIKKAINSKVQNQLVIEIECLEDSTFYGQTFIKINPTIKSQDNEFDVDGGFSSGFSDGYSLARGEHYGIINPIVSLVKSTIQFDVDEFLSDNAERLKMFFGLRIATRLLGDKLSSGSGKRLNIFTNSDRELTREQIEEINSYIKKELKYTCASLLFNINSTSTPPIELNGSVGYEIGTLVDMDRVGGDLSDEGAYSAFVID